MWQYVIRDYFRAYRWNNVKHAWKTTSRTSASILVVLMFILVDFFWEEVNVVSRIIIYGAYGLPLVFSWYATVIHPMALPKMLYLCPMDKNERRQYVVNSYIFKIAVSMIVSMSGLAVVIFNYGFDILVFITIIINNLIINLLIPTEIFMKENAGDYTGDLWYFSNFDAYKEWNKESAIKVALVFVITMFTNLIFIDITDADIADRGSATFVRVILFLIMLSIEIPLVISYRYFIKLHIREAEEYEAVDINK
ncbi:MAG: hypothetical protein IJ661_12910 [Lachnospiraceae bacterium]|nr:hypothetical protein [Lachnospiraceae bacterium]